MNPGTAARQDRYLRLLARRRFVAVLLGGLAGRLCYGVFPLALILAVQGATGSFGAAGVANGAVAAGIAVLAPARGRLLDRFGAGRMLPVLVVVFASALGVIALLASRRGAPVTVLVALSLVVGASSPPLGPVARVCYGRILDDRELLTMAYALDAVCEETLYIVGPALTSAVLLLGSASHALLTAIVLVVVGTAVLLFAAGSTATAPEAGLAPRRLSLLRLAAVQVLVASMLIAGFAYGVLEIGVPAFAAGHGATSASGLLIAALSAGSVLGGLWYGRVRWRRPVIRRYLDLMALFGLGLAVLALAPNLIVEGILLVVTGLPLSPLFTCSYVVVDERTSADRRTEAMQWITTAFNGGGAAGTGLGGPMVQAVGPGAIFAMAAGVVLLGWFAVGLRARAIPTG